MALTHQRIRRLSSDMQSVNQGRLDRQVLTQFARVAVKAKNLSCYLVDRQAKIVLDEIKNRLFRFCTDRRFGLPRQLHQIPVRTLYLFAEKQFNPEGPFAGEVVLFRATRGENDDEPYIERYQDPLLGWSPRARDGVRVHDVPGGHSSMLQEPHVRTLADQLQSAIDEALIARRALSHPHNRAESVELNVVR